MEQEKEFISVKEACRIAKKTNLTIYAWIKRGYLTKYKQGLELRIDKEELLEHIRPKKLK